MNESEKTLTSVSAQKETIRKRYSGIHKNKIEKISANTQVKFYDDDQIRRVAVYARVSTDDPRQTSSYELQKNYYLSLINRHSNWKLTKIYADEGISGTSLKRRHSFLKMIEDCKKGYIDIIIVKSVSRFARNVVDCIGYIRQLSAMHPPVGIYFETEGIYTLDASREMNLSFVAAMAQEESHNKSEIMNTSIEMRFSIGIFLTPKLLGYDHDENGNLIINENEAKTVQLIFFLYLYGFTCQKIADTLTKLKRTTKTGKTVWSPSSILEILQNERHCGDILARKTWTPNYLDHKSKKNRQERNQYRQIDHHQAIISRDDFIAVQQLIRNAKYGYRGLLPQLHVMTGGYLRGFVIIHPRWAGFKAKDYQKASETITDKIECSFSIEEFPFQSGEFDLRGFEVARASFFNHTDRLAVTFSYKRLSFSSACIKSFQSRYIQILVHPSAKLFAVTAIKETSKHSICWSNLRNSKLSPKIISGAAFLPNLYELFNWNQEYKYRMIGYLIKNGNGAILMFCLKDTEILIPGNTAAENKSCAVYPEDWVDTFGDTYYQQIHANQIISFEKEEKQESKMINPTPFQTTDPIVVMQNIEMLTNQMKQEVQNEFS